MNPKQSHTLPSVIYINSYLSNTIRKKRSITGYTPAGIWKNLAILRSLSGAGYQVTFISSGWKSTSLSGKWYGHQQEKVDNAKCLYAALIDIPGLNVIVNLFSKVFLGIAEIKHKKCIIIFDNYHIFNAIPALVLHLLFKIPMYILLFDGVFLLRKRRFLRILFERGLKSVIDTRISGALVINTLLKERLKKDNIVVNRGCVNKLFFEAFRPFRNNGTSRMQCLYGGELDTVRGIDSLLHALDWIEENDENTAVRLQIFICGKGQLSEYVERKAAQFKKIMLRYVGFLSDDEYWNLFKKVDVVFSLQKPDHPFSRVSFPSKICEAMAAGKIVISSRVADITTFAEDLAFICKDNSPQEIGDCIRKVIGAQQECAQRVQKARQWAQDYWSTEAVGRQFTSFLTQGS